MCGCHFDLVVIKMMIRKWLMVRITRILEIFSSLLKIVEDKEAFRKYHIMIVVQLYFEEAFISVKIVRTNMITDKKPSFFLKKYFHHRKICLD